MEEEFKFIPNSKFFEVSNLGRVRAVWGKDENKFYNYYTPQIKYGNFYVNYYTITGRNLKKISHLVAEQFIENPEEYKQIDFIDGDKFNCNAENIKWVKSRKYK